MEHAPEPFGRPPSPNLGEPDGDSATYLIAVRYRRGVVGENRRSCHLVRVIKGPNLPAALTALCGQQFVAEEAEQLEMFHGMPCFACLALATPSSTDEVPR